MASVVAFTGTNTGRVYSVGKTYTTGDGRTMFESPDGYDFSKPWKFNLPIELDEISGIVYYPKDTSVFAIIDEFGWLYKIHLTGNRQIGKWKFSEHGDYEDLSQFLACQAERSSY